MVPRQRAIIPKTSSSVQRECAYAEGLVGKYLRLHRRPGVEFQETRFNLQGFSADFNHDANIVPNKTKAVSFSQYAGAASRLNLSCCHAA